MRRSRRSIFIAAQHSIAAPSRRFVNGGRMVVAKARGSKHYPRHDRDAAFARMIRRKKLKAAGVRLAGGLGMHAAPRTPRNSLQELLKALRPVDPGIELVRLGP